MNKDITKVSTQEFIETVYGYYRLNQRDLPWRKPEADGQFDVYKIIVSEYMLQQTQVNRVIPKYEAFLKTFPSITVLSQASLAAVLKKWSGLGYNRRAKYLHETAKILAENPLSTRTVLVDLRLPGMGVNTKAAVMTYAYNEPTVFVETNIRTVYLHHFYAGLSDVTDTQLLTKIEMTLDRQNPREWYWALMDYGSYLKKSDENNIKHSRHYIPQSPFVGSTRQVRGQVIKLLTEYESMKIEELTKHIDDERLADVLRALLKEKLIQKSHDVYRLYDI